MKVDGKAKRKRVQISFRTFAAMSFASKSQPITNLHFYSAVQLLPVMTVRLRIVNSRVLLR